MIQRYTVENLEWTESILLVVVDEFEYEERKQDMNEEFYNVEIIIQ